MDSSTVDSATIDSDTKLGVSKSLILGLQHMFAMFGATVTVPLITGLDVGTTLLMAGLGTLLFHAITGGKIPAFLGSSFAFLGGYAVIAPKLEVEIGGEIQQIANTEMLPYACLGVACSAVLYFILAGLIKVFGIKKVMRCFPPIVTGPIIISIGLTLAPNAVDNCKDNWTLALLALCSVMICNIWGRGMIRIIPILLGLVVSYICAYLMGEIDFTAVNEAKWIGTTLTKSQTIFAIDYSNSALIWNAIIAIVPIALATIMEHIGDVCAISSTVDKDFVKDPGLHRTLVGDGLATAVASVFGGPANTTYGENTGVLALSKVFNPIVVRIAAVFAILLSFSPKFSALISTIPRSIVGGISCILYGMIASVGIRSLIENKINFKKSRILIIASVILVTALGRVSIPIGDKGAALTPLAIASLAGIFLNAIFPEHSQGAKTNRKVDKYSFLESNNGR